MFAPFRVGIVSDIRILTFGRFGKCAILLCYLSLQAQDGSGDFLQAYLRNIAGGNTQSIQGIGGIETADIAEILLRKVVRRIDAAPDKKHIANTALHQGTKQSVNVFFIQHFQIAALFVVAELSEVIRYVVLHGIRCRRQQSLR